MYPDRGARGAKAYGNEIDDFQDEPHNELIKRRKGEEKNFNLNFVLLEQHCNYNPRVVVNQKPKHKYGYVCVLKTVPSACFNEHPGR